VRFLGISEAAPATVRRAHAVHPITAGQYEYSLFSRDPEAEVLPLLRELGIGMACYSPLGRGMLTGALPAAGEFGKRDFRRSAPRFQGRNLEHNLAVAERIAALATINGVTPAQLALAWVLAQGDDLVAIPGTKRRAYLEQNVAAAEIVLTPDELRHLDELAPAGVAAGDRYPAEMMARLGR
jgi:aryl-alcohol dehydrogenase-like predicted oxidoreductase